MSASAGRAGTPSIRRRLGVSFAALAFILFGLMAAFEYLAFDRELERLRSQEVEGTAAVVLHLIEDTRAEPDSSVLRHRLDDIRLGHRGVHVWLIDRRGNAVYGDLPAPTLLQDSAAPGAGTEGDPPAKLMRMPDGRIERGAIHHLQQAQSAEIARLVLVVEAGDQARLRTSLARTLILALLAGTTLATVLGVWLSRRALAPLQAISARANTLSAASLGARLPEEGVDVEIRDLVASFNRALGRIETALRQQEAFSADVAHELNTPLATLIAGNEVALATGTDVSQYREQLADNLDELHRLEAIVADMLFLARADRGEMVRQFPPSSLAAIVGDVLEYHEAALTEAGLRVRVNGEDVAEVDSSLLKRAVSNLLSNATRFARSGTEIRIDITHSPEHARIAVTNTGDTIPAPQVPRIFDRFHRLEPSRSGSDRHHGLGLAIVSAIARMHGGQPFAESRDGRTRIGFTVARHRRTPSDPPVADDGRVHEAPPS